MSMYFYHEISKEEELARFEEAAIAYRKEVTASKKAALKFLISVGVLPPDYKLPKKNRSKTGKAKAAKPRTIRSSAKKLKASKQKRAKAKTIK